VTNADLATKETPATEFVRVLLAEDEESFVEALVIGLEREGFAITVARDGAEAIQRFDEGVFDLVLLDIMLPRISGLDVCRVIRAKSTVPIIMVTAKTTEIDTVVGLEVGADDYVAKPYRLRELVSRMHAVLRRSPRSHNPARSAAIHGTEPAVPIRPSSHVSAQVLEVGEVSLDLDRHECTVRGDEVVLPLKEFELLEQLLGNSGRVVPRDSLISRVWGEDYVGDTKTLDVHIKRLRSHIEVDPSQPRLITTIRGVGYRFEAPRRR
jgi:two-component system, OmpR family, response regulator RegX3